MVEEAADHTGDMLDFAYCLIVDVPAQAVFINGFAALGAQVGLTAAASSGGSFVPHERVRPEAAPYPIAAHRTASESLRHSVFLSAC